MCAQASRTLMRQVRRLAAPGTLHSFCALAFLECTTELVSCAIEDVLAFDNLVITTRPVDVARSGFNHALRRH